MQITKFKQSGLSVSITNPVIGAIETAQQMHQAASETRDARLKALAGTAAALSALHAVEKVKDNPTQLGGINISISLSTSKNDSTSTQSANTAGKLHDSAGRDVSIIAIGASADSDLTVRGTQILAGNDVRLQLTVISSFSLQRITLSSTRKQEQQRKCGSWLRAWWYTQMDSP